MEPNYGYRHTRGFIIFLVIILCGWVVVAHSQVSNTGNLVDSTWSNGYPVSALTCWQAGDPNCSPGRPYVRPDGNINFSYTATELYQARTLADVLPYSGTGLMVTGFQYNWRSKNGNGWDDGRLDVLQAYVQMYSKGGQWIESQTYSLNFVHNWTDFAWSGTFSKERRGSDLGTILYGFYGKDNNYWVGPYGPEITNVSFSLRYQPDPCVVNPLHSTDCPGFLKAIASPAYQAQESSAAITPIVAATTNSAPSVSLPTMTSAVVKLTARQEQFTQEAETLVAGSSSTSSSSSAVAMVNQAAAPVTVARVRTNSADYTENTFSIDSVLEQTSTVQTATTSTIVKNISSQARSNSARDTLTRLDNTPEITILDQPLRAVPETTSTTTVATVSTLPVQPGSTTQTIATDNQINYSLVEPVAINTNLQPVNIPVQTLIGLNQSAPVQETITVAEPIRAPAVETPTADSQSNLVASALIDRTNPLNDTLNGRQLLPPMTAVFAGPAVKANTQDNDLAGGVTISQIARVSAGFDVYQNLAIREIAFYQPREIYRGQRTVDNVRALRSLGQDAKHQEMVNQQYGGRLE
jgi:hypothetical protein